MSRRVHLSPTHGDDGGFELSCDGAVISLSELRIRGSSNMVRNHEVLGKGGSRMLLDSVECAQLIAEWMRYTFFFDTDLRYYTQQDTSFKFNAERAPPPAPK